MENEALCPCGTGRPYGQCCGIWHRGAPADDAEQLMRSRYSAFVLQNEAYLLATWHASRRPASIPFSPDQRWLGLRVIAAAEVSENAAEVEFVARMRVGSSQIIRHHERSRFVREAGAWFYVDGDLK